MTGGEAFPRTIVDMLLHGGQPDARSAIVSVVGSEVSYGRLRQQVRVVGGSLKAAGFGRGDRIALALPNGPLLASAILAVSAMYACAPLNPGFREGEFRHHLGTLGVKAVVAEGGQDSPARKVAKDMGLMVLEAWGSGDGTFSLEGLAGGGEPDYPGEGEDAFLLHTSGTTAVPKLVPLTQSNICHTAYFIGKALGLGAADRCLNVMALFHGLGLVSLLTTLLTGGSIVCAPGFDPGRFFGWLEELKPTWYTAVPPIHQSILDMAMARKAPMPAHRLRFIRSAAAPLPPRLMLGLEGLFKVPVLEAYGMTEAFIIGSSPPPPGKRKPGSVGVAGGPEVRVMDGEGGFVEDGRVGEIVVRGPNVMRGYEGGEAENASTFANGWLRTGDLGHIDREGYIYIDGRVKEVINRGGEKVTPNEVDIVLGEHPAVSEAATFGMPHDALCEDVAAAVVLREGAKATEDELRGFVSERLALYKVPSRIFFVREIPKGPSGKILRRSLPEVVGVSAAKGAPLSGVQKTYPRDSCVHRIFEEVVAREPIRTAIKAGSPLTYGELNAKANRLARRLISEGAGPGRFVGVCMERCVEFVISILAVLKTGAAYLPLYPSDPMGKIVAQAREAGIELVLTKRVYESMVPKGTRPVFFHTAMMEAAGLDSGDVGVYPPAGAAAYLLFVPDESGRPKGVVVPHRAVTRLVLGNNCAPIGQGDVVAHQSSPNTNIAAWEIWGALLNGALMTIWDLRTVLSPRQFARRLREDGVTALCLNTPIFNLFAREVPWAFKGLRSLVFTGEAADADAVRMVLREGRPQSLVNAYGSTEVTALSIFHHVSDEPKEGEAIPIGLPSANTKAYILDGSLQPVPAGSAGELFIGGDGVALGYINRPEATKGSFLPDPFFASGTVYKTGDFVRLDPGGALEFLGRRDRQVKIHGFRTELREVELAMMRHPAVKECSASFLKPSGGADLLVAHLEPKAQATPSGEDLYNFLHGKIPDHMIPSRFMWVGQLPSRPSAAAEIHTAVQGLSPGGAGTGGDDIERCLIAIWEDEMGVRGIGPKDNFFKIGGYSLMAVRIFSRMEKEFGIRLPLAKIYRKPTVAEIAAELRKAQPKGFGSLVALRAEGGRPRLFLVHAVDGEVYNYGRLVEALGEDQPVYGFVATGLRESAPLPATLEEMAASYIREMRALQPQGPYNLAGWCAGGLIAFEMAQQLERAGERVGLLGVLDFEAPEGERRRSRRAVRSVLLKEMLFLGGDLLRYGRRSRLGNLEIPSRVVRIERLCLRALGILGGDEEVLSGESAPLPENWKAVILNQLRLIKRYRPGRYGGVITVFKRELLPTISSPDPADGWRAYAGGGIVALPIRGRIHGYMLKPPSVLATARGIRERMDWHEGHGRSGGEGRSVRLTAPP